MENVDIAICSHCEVRGKCQCDACQHKTLGTTKMDIFINLMSAEAQGKQK